MFNPITITVSNFASHFNCTPVGLNDGRDIKLVGLGRSFLFCLLLGPPEFNCWFSFAPVFQWCCSTPQGSPGVGRNTLFLSSPHLCFIVVFIRGLFVSPWWSIDELKNQHADRTTVCFEPWQKPRARLGSCKTGLSPPSILILTVPRRYFCCGSLLILILAVRIYTLVQLLC